MYADVLDLPTTVRTLVGSLSLLLCLSKLFQTICFRGTRMVRHIIVYYHVLNYFLHVGICNFYALKKFN